MIPVGWVSGTIEQIKGGLEKTLILAVYSSFYGSK